MIKAKIIARNDNLGQVLNRFTKLDLVQDIYGLCLFKIYYRLDLVENHDTFPIHNSSEYIGENITISSVDFNDKEEKTIKNYKVVIVQISSKKHSISSNDEIIISGYSAEWYLNGRKKNRAFINTSLGEIVQKIMKPYPKPVLAAEIKVNYKEKIPYAVQYMETDMEFLRRLANRYGEWFYNNGKTICFGKLPATKSELTLGLELNKFGYDIKMNAFSKESLVYDNRKGKILKTSYKSNEIVDKVDNYHKKVIRVSDKKFLSEGNVEVAYMPLEEDSPENLLKMSKELKGNADIVNMTIIEAESTAPDIVIGQKLKILGLDSKKNKFSYGDYIVEKIKHNFSANYEYHNKMVLQSAKTQFPRNADPDLVPVCHDLKVAKVIDIQDPEKLGRIKVKFPWMNKDGDSESPWIQVSRPYISDKGGMFFLPEKGSEVLVGFESGNMERPYVYGSLYSKGTFKPDDKWEKENFYLRSLSGHTIHFADQSGKQNITIYDSDKCNKIVLSVSDKNLIIESKGDIKIKADGDLAIESGKKLSVKAASGIELASDSGIKINAKGSMDIKSNAGVKVDSSASLELVGATMKAEGKGTAELSSSGITTVKGSMVKIN